MSIEEDIKKACEVLRQGGLILYPTDTVWGIGCDATNSKAVARVYNLKQRCDSKALIVMLADENQLCRYIDYVPDIAYELIDVATKPLTIVYDNAINLCKELCAEDGSVGIRITREDFSKRLCKAFRRPIVSTSANISGQPTPIMFKDISNEIISGVDYVVENKRNQNGKSTPSSVIKLSHDNSIKILRP
ncbi:MAG: threonylcarbamoyl-AMP synthase [Muribaculaceae bacterium]|nr:threonylcarbamoyl-AMP synthase [Muribaculaceae bacterium]